MAYISLNQIHYYHGPEIKLSSIRKAPKLLKPSQPSQPSQLSTVIPTNVNRSSAQQNPTYGPLVLRSLFKWEPPILQTSTIPTTRKGENQDRSNQPVLQEPDGPPSYPEEAIGRGVGSNNHFYEGNVQCAKTSSQKGKSIVSLPEVDY